MFEPAVPARSQSVRTIWLVAALATTVDALSPSLHGQEIRRVSVDSSGAQSNSYSFNAAISGDGKFVAFDSAATNLVPSDANASDDVFVHDRSTGSTERVSVDSSGVEGGNDSWNPVLSRDGRYVAFESYATNFVPGDSGWGDVFVHDRSTGTTERVSVTSANKEANGDSGWAALSADGMVVAFQSDATNLITYDWNDVTDVFVHYRINGLTTRVSVSTSGTPGDARSYEPAISADASVVAFRSDATTLARNDTNGKSDIYVHKLNGKRTERVSISSSGGEGDGDSFQPALSSDGSIVAFSSYASNLVAGDTNSSADVFIRDRNGGTTERVSVDSTGSEGDGDSFRPTLSSDGRFVAFESHATNLVAGDINSKSDVFLHDRVTGTTVLVSINCALDQGDDGSYSPTLSDDGSVVAFMSLASNLVGGDTNKFHDIFADDLTVPPLLASWTNYGSGYAGTLGVPTLTASANPVFGTTISIDANNSSGVATLGLVVLGLDLAFIPTSAGGDLLVDPLAFTSLPLPQSGSSVSVDIPRDPALCGLSLYLQLLEPDPGAQHGISFTPGLQLTIGQ